MNALLPFEWIAAVRFLREGRLQTWFIVGGVAIGVAVIVSVYAAGAVPGQFVPGLQAAFLTSAGFAALALVVVATVLRTPRPEVVDRKSTRLNSSHRT